MRTASIVVMLGAGSCAGQTGMYGFTADGEVCLVESWPGTRTPVGHLHMPVLAAARSGPHVWVLSEGDRLHAIDVSAPRSLFSTVLIGRPPGFVVRAMTDGDWGQPDLLVILSDPAGRDWLYQINPAFGAYEPIGPTGTSGIRGVGGGYEASAITAQGGVFEMDRRTGATRFQTTIWPAGGPFECMGVDVSGRAVAVGVGLWVFDGGDPHTGWRPVQWRGFADLTSLVDFRERGCYVNCDTGQGPGVLDIFDYLCFQAEFAAGSPYACDCDLSTGLGACDVFDLLCYQNAFDAGCP